MESKFVVMLLRIEKILMIRLRKEKSYQELSRGLEIVKAVLSVEKSSGVVPGLAVFTSTTNVSDDHVTEMLREKQMSDRKAENENFSLKITRDN
jgi:hypothetical protein